MSRGQLGSPSEPTVAESHLVGAPAGGSPHNDPRAEDPVATTERYWRLFNDPGLLPPGVAATNPSPVSAEAFQDLTHQVQTLARMMQTFILPVSLSAPPPEVDLPFRSNPPAPVHLTSSALPTLPRTRQVPFEG
ncbi:unnamed protein product [Musa textilis]